MLPPAVVGCTGRSSQLHVVVTSCCWPFEAETPNFFIDVLFGVGVYYLLGSERMDILEPCAYLPTLAFPVTFNPPE